MTYAKPVMTASELRKMGFTREIIEKAFREPGQTFAWKVDPFKRNSPIMIDTEGFEKWRLKQVRASGRSILA